MKTGKERKLLRRNDRAYLGDPRYTSEIRREVYDKAVELGQTRGRPNKIRDKRIEDLNKGVISPKFRHLYKDEIKAAVATTEARRIEQERIADVQRRRWLKTLSKHARRKYLRRHRTPGEV